MWLKLLLAACFIFSLLGAFVLAPKQKFSRHNDDAAVPGNQNQNGRRLRLLSWNIGNGDLESETRAHAEDLPAVAKVIMDNGPDAVALQELTGEDQLKLLLARLKNQYSGYVCSRGSSDRVGLILNEHGLNAIGAAATAHVAAILILQARQQYFQLILTGQFLKRHSVRTVIHNYLC